MEQTNNKTGLYVTVGIVVVVLIALGVYFFRSSEDTDTYVPNNDSAYVDDSYEQIVNVKHQYKDGTHTFAGSIDVATPCHSLTSSVAKDPSDAKHFSIAFLSAKDDKVACAQVITSKPFKVSFAGPSDAKVDATLNGKKIRLNIFEVSSSQNLDDFNIYIKG